MARREGRLSEELMMLYTLEAFLRRLVASPRRDDFVLKGGVLLAAFGDRRPTRDLDFHTRQLAGDVAAVTRVVQEIASIALDDGVTFDAESASGRVIREDAQYDGVRVRMNAALHTARPVLIVDVNVGDPVTPAPRRITVPTLLGNGAIAMLGYPLPMVLAEKIVTAIERRAVNTRWRDFADVWILSRRHECSGDELDAALHGVADHRGVPLQPLLPLLRELPHRGEGRWSVWRDRNKTAAPVPRRLDDVLVDVATFADRPLRGEARGWRWDPAPLLWVPAAGAT
jgi:hypothetical protein